jgi:hypothetical protein
MPPRKPKPKRSLKNKTNPWDIPPVPAKGDDDINITYASIGRALSKWEEFEEQLSYAFAIFCGGADDQLNRPSALMVLLLHLEDAQTSSEAPPKLTFI